MHNKKCENCGGTKADRFYYLGKIIYLCFGCSTSPFYEIEKNISKNKEIRINHKVDSKTIKSIELKIDSNQLDFNSEECLKSLFSGMYKMEIKTTCSMEFFKDFMELLEKHGLPVDNNY